MVKIMQWILARTYKIKVAHHDSIPFVPREVATQNGPSRLLVQHMVLTVLDFVREFDVELVR